jgi:hypothetical protein
MALAWDEIYLPPCGAMQQQPKKALQLGYEDRFKYETETEKDSQK